MKPESLHALLIDRHFGELSPEAAELLEHHLAIHAPARAEADRLLAALTAAETAVQQYPELARVPVAANAPRTARRRWSHGLARAAAMLTLAGLAGTGGYLAGRGSPPPSLTQATPRAVSPWARYRMAFDPAGTGFRIVRVDKAAPTTPSVQ